MDRSLVDVLDTVADRTLLLGHSWLGYRLRRARWRVDDPAPGSLAGRVAVVTSARSALGRTVALGLAELGATVVVLVDDDRGHGGMPADHARGQLSRSAPGADVRLARCDVSDLDDIDRCVRALTVRYPAIDVLVHTAAELPSTRLESRQGHELTLAVHVLGALRLTEGLSGALSVAADPRVIWLSSGGIYTQAILGDDLQSRHEPYRATAAYARTKRLQVAFTPLLAHRYAGVGIGVHASHPGWTDSTGRLSTTPWSQRITLPLHRSPAEGADTVRWLAATRPAPPTGLLWHDRRPRATHLTGQHDNPEHLHRAWRTCLTLANLEPTHNDTLR